HPSHINNDRHQLSARGKWGKWRPVTDRGLHGWHRYFSPEATPTAVVHRELNSPRDESVRLADIKPACAWLRRETHQSSTFRYVGALALPQLLLSTLNHQLSTQFESVLSPVLRFSNC